MSLQETFTTVATHLLTQRRRSIARLAGQAIPSCAYRGEEGLRCAVGCLIPDEEYRPEFEGCKLFSIPLDPVMDAPMHSSRCLQQILLREGHDLGLLVELQAVHDRVRPDNWAMALSDVASRFGLQMPTVPQ